MTAADGRLGSRMALVAAAAVLAAACTPAPSTTAPMASSQGAHPSRAASPAAPSPRPAPTALSIPAGFQPGPAWVPFGDPIVVEPGITTATTTGHGIKVTITADAASFRAEDGLWVTTRLENVGENTLHWMTDGCQRHVGLLARTGLQWAFGAEQFDPHKTYKDWALRLYRDSAPRPITLSTTPEWAVGRGEYGCADVGMLHRLKPGKEIESRAFVDDGAARGNTNGPPPGGPILLTGVFDFWSRGKDEPEFEGNEPILVDLAVEMTDGRDAAVLSPGQAIDAALGTAEIAKVIREHPAIPDWSPHVLRFDPVTVQWIVGVTLDARRADATEGKTLARQITAVIDARTGRVLEVREEALGIS